MSIETKAIEVVRQARELATKASTWADFAAEVFDQSNGLVAKAFPSDFQRQAFLDSPQYQELSALLLEVTKRTGVVAGAARTEKSGRFVVRVPKTLHHCLEIEAKCEGVSLNQLAVSKLSLPLQNATNFELDLIAQAFNATHEGHSQDWIIVHPELNMKFLEKCRTVGLKNPDRILNHSLMNIRKNPKYKGKLNATTKRTGFKDYDDFAYASEIAVRAVQRTEGVTLDRILCDPDVRARFDDIAHQLAPHVDALRLRCAALNLRKTHRLKPISDNVINYELVAVGPVRSVNLADIVDQPGGYAFYDQSRPIFAGQTDNLKKRVARHLDRAFPEWLGIEDQSTLILKTLSIPGKQDDRLDWLGSFINSERPLLNYQKAA